MDNYKIKLVKIIFLLFISVEIQAQTDAHNQTKY